MGFDHVTPLLCLALLGSTACDREVRESESLAGDSAAADTVGTPPVEEGPTSNDSAPPDTLIAPAPAPLPSPDVFLPLADVDGGELTARVMTTPGTSSDVTRYWLYLPPGYDAAGPPWPLLLYLHGRSLRGADLERVKRYGIPQLLGAGRDLPFVVVAPQLPDGQRWTDMDRLGELVQEVVSAVRIDPDRLYVTGFSMGGGGAWRFAARHHDQIAAVVAVAATTPPPTPDFLDALAGMPARVYHGTRDDDASYDDARTIVGALQPRSGAVELVTLEGRDHNIVAEVYSSEDVYRWLLMQRRSSRR